MKKKILNTYNFILVVSLLFVGIKVAHTLIDFVFFILLAPVVVYFFTKLISAFPLGEPHYSKLNNLKRFLLFYSVLFTIFLIVLQIKTVKTWQDLGVVILFAPVLVGFTLELIAYFKRPETIDALYVEPEDTIDENSAEEIEIVEGVQEVQRRKFFKSMAGAGLGLFLFYIVKPHKAEAAFFGSMPGPGTIAIKDSGGTVIDPAIKLPTDGYGIADVDDTTFSDIVLYHYYGFTKSGGYWYILRVGSDNSYKYNKGTTDYQTNWTNRASLTPYDTFGNTF